MRKNSKNVEQAMNDNMTDQLLRTVLGIQFTDDVLLENVLTIIKATPNAQVAALLLTNSYNRPAINVTSLDTKDLVNKRFVSFDIFTNEVTFLCNRRNSKEAWFKIGNDAVEENIVSSARWEDSVARELGIPEDEVRKSYVRLTYYSEVGTEDIVRKESLNTWSEDE